MKKLVSFLEENLNKNTKTKTKSDMKVITDFFTSIGEERAPGQIVLWLESSWMYSKRMVLNMNQILWVPCKTVLTDT